MSVYVIADIEVTDPEAFERYRQAVPATITAHGGRYLARGGALTVLEGDWSPRRCVVLEFPDRARFQAWWDSPEYVPLRELRVRSTRSRLVLVEGL